MNGLTRTQRRAFRTRRSIQRPVDTGRLRLSVFRSARFIYAQVIDDKRGVTVAEANSRSMAPKGNKTDQAKAVGQELAQRAIAAGVKRVVFRLPNAGNPEPVKGLGSRITGDSDAGRSTIFEEMPRASTPRTVSTAPRAACAESRTVRARAG